MYFNSKSFMPSDHIRLSAWLEHAPFVFWLVDTLRPRSVVELGTHNGFSFLSMCQAAKATGLRTQIYAIDTWEGDEHAGFYSSEIHDLLKSELQAQYPDIGVMIRSRFDDARPQFKDGSVDLLHIDGRHKYEDVTEDFEIWKSSLSDRGVVLFHDTRVQRSDFGVWKFWKELKVQYPAFEFSHGNGLGVLMVGTKAPGLLSDVNNANPEEKLLIQELYARLGYLNSVLFDANRTASHFVSAVEQAGLTADETKKLRASNAFELVKALQRKNSDEIKRISEIRDRQYDCLNREHTRLKAIYDEAKADLMRSETEKNTLQEEIHQERQRYENEKNALQEEIELERKRYEDLLSSRSWQLTAPYRYVGRQSRRTAHVMRTLPSIISRAGGVKAITSKALDTYRTEGLSGLKRRWRRANVPGNQVQISLDGKIVDRNDYFEWIRLYGSLDQSDRDRIGKSIDSMVLKPTISIIMPVYNANLDWLREAVDSIRKQLYPNWELCIADDCSPNPAVRRELEALQKSDQRIHVIFREKNGHISAASNSAMESATGDWLALMDQDDLLPEDALYHIAYTIISNPKAGIIYSDEDKIDETGRRFDPYFKSDWNPDLFLSHNMVSHLGVYQRDLVQRLGGFREGFEGSQDYDLAMRMIEMLTPEQIVHIPKILYHWRSHSDSTAQAGSNKNYALLAGQKTLDDHFKRTGVAARAELLDFGMYRTHYALPNDMPLVSLIIPTRNGLSLIKQCIDSIVEKTTYTNYEIIIVDNNSDDPDTLAYFAAIKDDERIRVLRDERPFNYSALNNAAVEQAKGQYVGLLNNDIEVISPNWLSEMLSIASQPGVGAVGAKLWYPDDTLQHGGVIVGLGGVAGHAHSRIKRTDLGYFGRASLIQTMSAVTAACLVIRKDIYNEVGGLDEVNLAVAFNDVDFCLKVQSAGYRNIWTPFAELYHHESATRGLDDAPEKKRRFLSEVQHMKEAWSTDTWKDPSYNPNLALDQSDFSLAWPPRL